MNRSTQRLLLAVAALTAVAISVAAGWSLFHAPRNVIAAAPGWVDVEGGIQRLGVRIEGTVDAVAVRDGDHVADGALLLRLDDQQAALDRSAAQLDADRRLQEQGALTGQVQRARQELERLRPLVEQQAEPADELRAATARLSDLQSQLQLAAIDRRAADLHLEMLTVRRRRQELRAPAAGDILRVLTHAGDAVAPGTPLLWFVATGPRIVRAELDERLFGQVSAGMRAEISPEYDDSLVYKARVTRVATAVGPVQALPELRPSVKDDRIVECVLSVDGNDLLIGQRVLVTILGTP